MVYFSYTTQTFASIIQIYRSICAPATFSLIYVYLPLLLDARKTFCPHIFLFSTEILYKKREKTKNTTEMKNGESRFCVDARTQYKGYLLLYTTKATTHNTLFNVCLYIYILCIFCVLPVMYHIFGDNKKKKKNQQKTFSRRSFFVYCGYEIYICIYTVYIYSKHRIYNI